MKYLRRHSQGLLLGLCVVLALLWLSWLTWDGRQQLLQLSQSALLTPAVSAPIPRPSPDTIAIAGLFGLQPQRVNEALAEVPLKLLASLVAVVGEGSRALIASPDGQRFYQPGDTLPGGALLQQISADQVLLQRFGQSQVLALQPEPRSQLLQRHDGPAAAVDPKALSLLVQP